MSKKTAKKILYILIFIIIVAGGVYMYFSPTPNFMRNNSVDGVKVEVKTSTDSRKPIVRTFRKDDYLNLSEEKLAKVKKKISGRIEGDLPSIHLNEGNKIYFTFEKDGKVFEPEIPRVKITAHASSYKDDVKTREIEGELDRNEDGKYFYATKRYSTQFEKYFTEYLRFEIYFISEDVEYVTTFATFQDNANYGTDFFNNEDLENPIPPEE